MKNLLKTVLREKIYRPLNIIIKALLSQKQNSESLQSEQSKDLKYNIQTFEVMKKVLYKNSNCIDIGCHKGKILKQMLSLSPNGNHFAFEPIPSMYHNLLDSFGPNNNINIYGYALSDKKGTSSFKYVVSNPGYSGFRRRRYDRPKEQVQEISVKTDKLDNVVPKNIPIHLIKVDVEGAELQVFRGAVDTIKRNRPVVIFEHGLGGADYYETTPEDIFNLLSEQCGLRLFTMYEWLKSNGKDHLNKGNFCEEFYSGNNYYFMAAL